MKKYALILIVISCPSCLVVTKPDGTTAKSIDGPAVVTAVDQYFRLKQGDRINNEK